MLSTVGVNDNVYGFFGFCTFVHQQCINSHIYCLSSGDFAKSTPPIRWKRFVSFENLYDMNMSEHPFWPIYVQFKNSLFSFVHIFYDFITTLSCKIFICKLDKLLWHHVSLSDSLVYSPSFLAETSFPQFHLAVPQTLLLLSHFPVGEMDCCFLSIFQIHHTPNLCMVRLKSCFCQLFLKL